jgi:hypothetical protein
MRKAIHHNDVLARVEALRDAEWEARQPLLAMFRQTAKEQQIRSAEGPVPTITLDECVVSGRIAEFGRAIELLCQEGLRFERWLDTLPSGETEAYWECRRRLP